ncbi:sterol esterase from carbohydrate esterase family CE10 [Pyrrhoderma noxium]|uniref:Carboxylic ester hydrolase n=1 Tax=Pyrrhoderma noxium TaxID=2282107 RepID=A0A286UG75_9AGAM|nr:sterol esterase from carbohydrate esterase family CE10 [Pyrrhoderma noxium]
MARFFLSPRVVQFLLASCLSNVVLAGSTSGAPTLTLDYGTFQGTSTGNLTLFLGMPFARAPVDELRFAPPQPPLSLEGVQNASAYGPACPQSLQDDIEGGGSSTIDENCLSVNVIKPSDILDGTKLPVLFWIFGGGFTTGSASSHPGNPIVERSIALGEPVIHVSANYRLNAFGFLPGEEVLEAGIANAGIRDQRFALEWVHENIDKFGGDPSKVVLWGGSAGSMSVATQITLNDGDTQGLYRGAVMHSGTSFHAKLDVKEAQPYYDSIVNITGCSEASDTLSCLRNVSMEAIVEAVEQLPSPRSYTSLNTVWSPRTDGQLIKSDPVPILKQGLYAKVPIITGDVDDEGTLFSLAQTNITTNEQFLDFVESNYLTGISEEELQAIGEAYPEDPSQGSPFGTGNAYAITPEYKRLAAFQGDLVFQAPRRFLLQILSQTQDTWSYLYKRGKNNTAIIGTSHGSDIPYFYGANTTDFLGTDAIINFANTLNPMLPENPISLLTSSGLTWDCYGSSVDSPPLLTFIDPAPEATITSDTYRNDGIGLLNKIAAELQGSG